MPGSLPTDALFVLRVWLHCVNSYGSKKLIFSPDTDVYHIRLTAVQHMPEAEVIVQLSKGYKDDPKFLCLNKLQQALCDDPVYQFTCDYRPFKHYTLVQVATMCHFLQGSER